MKLENLPFDIPDNWTWIRFSSLVNFTLGKTPERHNQNYWENGEYPWVSIADMKEKQVLLSTKEKISKKALIDNFDSKLSPIGTLIMSFKLTVGRVSILGIASTHNEAIISIFPYLNPNNSIRDWLFYTLGSIVQFVDQTDAIKGATLNKGKISSMLVPIPPLNEQSKIIKRILDIKPLFAKYDSVEKKLSALEAEFPERLKKSILQYAIEGKLVKQDPNDEPASVLLERIKAEKEKLIKEGKIKRDKNESYIYQGDDKNYYEKIGNNSRRIEVPFESNENSIWVRLATICTKIVDGNHNPPKGELFPTNYLMLSSQNINDDSVVNLNICRYLTEERFEIENSRTSISLNDILFTSVGTLGRTCVYVGPLNICFQRSVTVISTLINPRYLKMFLDTPMFQFKVYKEATGTAQKGFYLNQLASSFVLIYPSDYQNRVVAKTDDLFKIIQ